MAIFSLIRVDYRLAHGQVRASWYNHINPKKLYILDDETAADPFLLKLMASTMMGCDVKAYTIEKGVERYKKDGFGKGKTMIIFRDIASAYKAYELGFEFPHLNVGQVPNTEERRLAVATVCLSDEELDKLKELSSNGVEVYTQQTIENKKYTMEDIIASMQN